MGEVGVTRSYEELTGGLGRAISFRAERHLVRDFLLWSAADIQIQHQSYPLYDISMSGVSFFSAVREDWGIGTELEVVIHVHQEVAYRGLARIARMETQHRQMRIALHLLTGFLDLHEMQRRNDEIIFERDLKDGNEEIWAVVPKLYKDTLSELLHFIAFYKRVLDRYEARLQLQDSRSLSETHDRVVRRAYEDLRERWQALICKGTAAASLHEGAIRSAAKTYTEAVLTPLLLEVPLLHRAYTKPYGYAGDYEVMLYLYRNGYEGDSLFGQVFHKLICDEPLAQGIRTRKDLIKSLSIQEELRVHRESAEPFRVMSLGCGPALEVIEFIRDSGAWGGPIQWTLIDQEEKALSLALRNVLRQLGPRKGEGQVRCLHLSFEQLVQDPSSIISSESQNFIYCAGLFDYLSMRRAQLLVQALYERLAPGGLLAVGNALAPNTHSWLIDYASDWVLIYRTAETVAEMAKLVPSAQIDVVTEASKAYHFLLLRKP